AHWGAGPADASVPEPGTFCLLIGLLAALPAWTRHRRR
ncbi:MAG: PEP-CTERM sorting domain-containing protein, partial [Pirellulales bacterium]|nr:PEP-CTERM sorting domain-containing protein [Pirellulales bacterium]